jgi:hypothetical protein
VAKKDRPDKGKRKKPGRRFQSGAEDLRQLEGIESRQRQVRSTRHKLEKSGSQSIHDDPGALIERIDKTKRRLKNRLGHIKGYEDALREFDS